jgi:hypothetical protein
LLLPTQNNDVAVLPQFFDDNKLAGLKQHGQHRWDNIDGTMTGIVQVQALDDEIIKDAVAVRASQCPPVSPIPNPQPHIPNPQSPIPNPQSPIPEFSIPHPAREDLLIPWAAFGAVYF